MRKELAFSFLLAVASATHSTAGAYKLLESVKLKAESGYDFRAGAPKSAAIAPKFVVERQKPMTPAEIQANISEGTKAVSDGLATIEKIQEKEAGKTSTKPAMPVPESVAVPEPAPLTPPEPATAEAPIEATKIPPPTTNPSEKADLTLKFKPKAENLTKADLKKVKELADRVKKMPEASVKIMSYYDQNEEMNAAFARLLNARKALFDGGISTSQAIIMVIEDESKAKNNSIEMVVIDNR